MIQIIKRTGLNTEPKEQIIELTPSASTTSLSANFDANAVFMPLNLTTGKRDLIFVTGSLNKYNELVSYFQDDRFKGINIIRRDVDLQEIQHASPLKIVEEKCKSAYLLLNPSSRDNKYPILIEDTSLGYDEWNGLPGPYIKWFLQEIGPVGLHKMLDSFSNKSATLTCTYAIMHNPDEIVFCHGAIHGQIVSPRGSNGFGFDSCFQENQTQLTFAEMDEATKQKHSHRSNAVQALQHYLSLLEKNLLAYDENIR